MKKFFFPWFFILCFLSNLNSTGFSEEIRMESSEKNWSIFVPKDKKECLSVFKHFKETLVIIKFFSFEKMISYYLVETKR